MSSLGPRYDGQRGKLKLVDFAPLIAKVDRYLSGWHAILMSYAARVVLLNAVLDAVPVYAMGAVTLPPALVCALDTLRRAFLWDAADRPSGAKCLIAWERVCHPKSEGGLGVRCIKTKTVCLQVLLLHKLHSQPDDRWCVWTWARLRGPVCDQRAPRAGPHWNALVELQPLYRSLC